MMYRHMIDEILDRSKHELRIYKKNRREEDAQHVLNRIDSLTRLRRTAPVARFKPPKGRPEERKTLEQILMEYRP